MKARICELCVFYTRCSTSHMRVSAPHTSTTSTLQSRDDDETYILLVKSFVWLKLQLYIAAVCARAVQKSNTF